MQSNVEIAREYVKAIESGATGGALARFFTSDVVIQVDAQSCGTKWIDL